MTLGHGSYPVVQWEGIPAPSPPPPPPPPPLWHGVMGDVGIVAVIMTVFDYMWKPPMFSVAGYPRPAS